MLLIFGAFCEWNNFCWSQQVNHKKNISVYRLTEKQFGESKWHTTKFVLVSTSVPQNATLLSTQRECLLDTVSGKFFSQENKKATDILSSEHVHWTVTLGHITGFETEEQFQSEKWGGKSDGY